jgi:hypothetical protein
MASWKHDNATFSASRQSYYANMHKTQEGWSLHSIFQSQQDTNILSIMSEEQIPP